VLLWRISIAAERSRKRKRECDELQKEPSRWRKRDEVGYVIFFPLSLPNFVKGSLSLHTTQHSIDFLPLS
jgi:hypothetical protein